MKNTIINIKYDGTEESILRIMEHLPGGNKCIRKEGKAITIPTLSGAKQVFIGEIVVIDGLKVNVLEI